MFKSLSDNMKNMLIDSLIKKYDKINSKLQRDFVRTHYDEDEIEAMEEELKRIDEMIKELKED
jgi:phosphoribosylaminoimidazole-succinocarboxamide synthase